MPHYVAFVEMHEWQAVDPLQNIDGFDQAAAARVGKVDLRDVAGDHGFRAESEAGNEDLHLLGGSGLCVVEYGAGIVGGAAADVGGGRGHYDVFFGIERDWCGGH